MEWLLCPGRFDEGEENAQLTGDLARTLAARHLGRSPLGDNFSVIVATGDSHRYVIAVRGDEDRDLAEAAADELAANARFVVGVGRDAGPLALAVALWRELLKELTVTELPGLQRHVPTATDELRAAVEAQFNNQKNELAALAHRLLPTLAQRIVERVGWTGFRAHLLEARETRLLPSQPPSRFHSLLSNFEGEQVVVTAWPDPRPDVEFRSQGIAEMFAEEPPEDAALEALVEELNKLLPEIG